MFFENWYGFLQVFISSLIAYTTLIIWLRVSGKRTLSKWNAFDFIVTIALGSILATVILSKDVKILEGVLGSVLLILFQFIITWFSVRIDLFENLVKANPTVLFDKDKFIFGEMTKQRVTKSEILAAVRAANIGSLTKVSAVVLETDGSFSIIKKSEVENSRTALEDVKGIE